MKKIQDCSCEPEFISSLNFKALVIHNFFHQIFQHINDEKKFYQIYQIFQDAISTCKIFYPQVEIHLDSDLEYVKLKRIYFDFTIKQILEAAFEIRRIDKKQIQGIIFKEKNF